MLDESCLMNGLRFGNWSGTAVTGFHHGASFLSSIHVPTVLNDFLSQFQQSMV